jgi:hypothetical protein
MRLLAPAFLALFVFTAIGSGQDNVAKWRADLLSEPAFSRVERVGSLRKFDLSPLWMTTDNEYIYGFIGAKHRRIRIKILTAERSKTDPLLYEISGASLVGENFRGFRGTISIAHARFTKMIDAEFATEDDVRSRGFLLANYRFTEAGSDKHSGVFSGLLQTNFYIDKSGKIHYDDLESGADGFLNNQFAGTWRAADGSLELDCNWGDYRIPLSGDLDIGDGEFSPNEKYWPNGWRSLYDAHFKQDAASMKEEARKWWKKPENGQRSPD